MRRSQQIFFTAFLAVLMTAGAASAKKAAEKPQQVELTSEGGLEWDANKKTLTAEKKALVVRGDTAMGADKITAYYKDGENGRDGEVYQVRAFGNIVITTPKQSVWADSAVYEIEKSVIILKGNPVKLVAGREQLTARVLELWQNEDMAVARRSVMAQKDARRLEADVVKAYFVKRDGKSQVERFEAENNVVITNDKEKVLAVARKERTPESPLEIIKDPMVLEFLGLERKPAYYEKDLESALISHIADFLLELGKGFSFVARQKRLLIEDDEYFADLVFYNRLLRCFVVIELKTHKLTHQDLGQLQLYVNYYDRYEKQPEENPTIGILLCTDKNDTAVRLTLPEDNKTILASKYQLYLPTSDQLIEQINQVRRLASNIEEKKEKK